MIIYLHGFRSAPASHKARSLAARAVERGLTDAFWCEQLPVSAQAAMALVEPVVERALASPGPAPTLVGSSLGGYYATWLAERHRLKAVVVNPAVLAPISLEAYLGPQSNLYTGEQFDFTAAHIAELQALDAGPLRDPRRYWLLAEEGDEVLDYRHAVARYAGSRQTILPGGDHSFTRWTDFLDEILCFAGLLPA